MYISGAYAPNALRKGGVGVGELKSEEQPAHVSTHHTHAPTAYMTGELRVLKHVETANSRVTVLYEFYIIAMHIWR